MDFALCRSGRDGDQCYLVDVPEDLREAAWAAVQDPVTWKAFIETLPTTTFQSWYPNIIFGLRALWAIDMTSQSNTKLTEATAVHLRIAAYSLNRAAGLMESTQHSAENPREAKLAALIESLQADARRNPNAITRDDAATSPPALEYLRDGALSLAASGAGASGKDRQTVEARKG